MAFSFLLLFISCFPKSAKAEGASLYFSPSSGTFFVGSTFDVSVFVNTDGEDINAVEVNLKFDPKKLQVASPTAGKSFIEVWVAQPTYSNIKGIINFIGGVPSPGINTSAGLVSTITFRVIEPGETSISFSDTSQVLRNDPRGTDVLTSLGRGNFTLLIPPPEGPKVSSPTHPDQNKWYKNNNPTFSWEKEEGVTDFSYSFDQDPMGTPDNLSEGSHTSISYSEVKDGMWYFHIKAKKAGTWGGMSHYLVRIDVTPPALFNPTVEPSKKTSNKEPLVSFITTDALSGISYYRIKYINITPKTATEDEVGFFTEVTSPYKLSSLNIGKYLVVVRAYDIAGNWREGTINIEIVPGRIFFVRRGIQFKDITLPWWLILLIAVIILLIYLSFYRKKQRYRVGEKETKLKEINKKLEEQFRKIINRFKKRTYGTK